jgi:hypothetical protein
VNIWSAWFDDVPRLPDKFGKAFLALIAADAGERFDCIDLLAE